MGKFTGADVKLAGWNAKQVEQAVASLQKFTNKAASESHDLLADADDEVGNEGHVLVMHVDMQVCAAGRLFPLGTCVFPKAAFSSAQPGMLTQTGS
eukprot:821054-Pelagomonas_calceolata.AAC.2